VWEILPASGRVLRGHFNFVQNLSFAPDGSRLASGGNDGTVRVWDLRNEEARILYRHDGILRAVHFLADGNTVASGGSDRTMRVSKVGTSDTHVYQMPAIVQVLERSADGRSLAAGLSDGSLWVWDVRAGTNRLVGRHEGGINTLAFSPDGNW